MARRTGSSIVRIVVERNSSRIWLEREVALFAAACPPGSRVLDAGAGHQPYRPMFAHCRYEAADFEKVDKEYARSSVVCDLTLLPIADQAYDAILFSQVMEHLAEPARVMEEFARVLRPGGRIFCSAPLFYEEHEQPYDFFRYTQFGMRRLLERAGFQVEEMRWLEGYLGTVGHQLQAMGRWLPRHPRHYGGGVAGTLGGALATVLRPVLRRLGLLMHRFDAVNRYTARGMPKNWLALAVKPRAPAQ